MLGLGVRQVWCPCLRHWPGWQEGLVRHRHSRTAREIPTDIGLQAALGHLRSKGVPQRTVALIAAVAIFETHNVMELSGTCLKDDRVL
jgi:hypothetical protein